MRENKYRGISVGLNKFVYGGLVRANTKKHGNCLAIKDSVYNINNGCNNFIPKVVKPETVGQFIELKGDNNKDIYEGDVVDYIGDGLYKIHYYYGSFMLKSKTRSMPIMDIDTENDLIIIGNIYENPELLEE